MQFHVLIEEDENGGFIATVPFMRGCVSDGRTRSEAMFNSKEAMQLWLEAMDEMAVDALSPEQKQHLVTLAPEFVEQAQAA